MLVNLLKNMLAIMLGLVLLLAAEGLLLALGVTPLARDDSFVGFSGAVPLFLADDAGNYSLNPAKERYFNQQGFVMPKPQKGFRLVAFGGSTTYGRPYLDNTSFVAWLERLLQRYAAPGAYDRINAGGISYASYRVVRLMHEMKQYSPDLYVVYAGHNEFLEARTFAALVNENTLLRQVRSQLHRSRIYSAMHRALAHSGKDSGMADGSQLGDEVKARLESVGGPDLYHRDPDFRDGVVRQYRQSVREMVALSRESGIPLILCTLPSNLSGVSPFKSEHRDRMKAEELHRWNDAFKDAEQAMLSGQPEVALSRLSIAEALDPGFALLHYRKGQALQALGQFPQAYEAFVRAKQEDIVPLRALEEFNQILREVADAEQVPLADVEAMFRRVSPDGIPGNNLFVDHVHPSLEGQQMVAWAIMNTAVKWGLVPMSETRWQQVMVDAREFLRSALGEITPRYRAMGIWGVGRVFYWAGKYPEAYEALTEAWQTVKDVPDIPRTLGRLELSQGRGALALEYLQAADALEPGNVMGMIALARTYLLMGDEAKAMETIENLEKIDHDNPLVVSTKGHILLSLDRRAEGLAELNKVVSLAPSVPKYRLDLALVLAKSGQMEQAESQYRTYLDLTRHPVPERELAAWREQFEAQQGRAVD